MTIKKYAILRKLVNLNIIVICISSNNYRNWQIELGIPVQKVGNSFKFKRLIVRTNNKKHRLIQKCIKPWCFCPLKICPRIIFFFP